MRAYPGYPVRTGFPWPWLVTMLLAVPVALMIFLPTPPRLDRAAPDGGTRGGGRMMAAAREAGGEGAARTGERGWAERMKERLQPGDIILGRCRLSPVPSLNPARGWTHAALYVGGGELVVAANPMQGTVRTTVGSWCVPRMTWVVCLPVTSATEEERMLAAKLAEEEVGTSYDLNWFAEQEDGETWYCSELPWAVYRRATGGRVDLENGLGWFGISPDDLFLHPDTEVVDGHFERRPDTILSLLLKALTLCALFGVASVLRG